MKIRFSNGQPVETSDEYHVVSGPDGWYIIGRGILVVVDKYSEAAAMIDELNKQRAGNRNQHSITNVTPQM